MEIALLCKVAHAIQRLACIYLFDEDAFRSGKADAELLDLGRYNAPTAKTVCTVQRGGLLEWARHRYAAKLLQIFQEGADDLTERLRLMLDRDELHMERISQECGAVDKAGGKTAVSSRDAHIAYGCSLRIGGDLLPELRRSLYIAKRASCGGCAVIDDVRRTPLTAQGLRDLLHRSGSLFFAYTAQIVFLCAEDVVEQRISFEQFRPRAVVDDHAPQSQPAARGRAEGAQV